MMKRVSSKFLPALAALAAVCMAGAAQAAVITMTYVNGQVSTVSNFTSATTTAVSVAQMTNGSLNIPNGQFFRFGIALLVTGNPNPEAGSAFDQDNQANGKPALPANLGMSTVGIKITNSDAAGSRVAPLASGTKTRVVFNGALDFTSSDAGDVAGGNAGVPSSIFLGQGPASTSSTGIPKLGYFTTTTNFFDRLPYAVTDSSNSATLTPAFDPLSTSIWKRTVPGGGDASEPPTYLATFLTPADTMNLPAPILINSNVPEPASMGALALGLIGMLSSRRRVN